ncbi:MAG: pyridoxamine 5'-phosphate oxidase family protein [Oscillospiraceae bacterium]|nr:pyridoxamine 5'-phosphate oxidase family protein [Oscillospiraceae bacterium]
MFPEMKRIRQRLPESECLEILKQEPRGVLSVLGEDGYPYGVPINHWYCEEDGKIYFHGGRIGHKIDAMRRCDKVSFCVYDEGYRREGEWALNIRSVVVFGRVAFIEDPERVAEISRQLSYKFTRDEDYIAEEIRTAGARTLCFALTPEHIRGKLVNEA